MVVKIGIIKSGNIGTSPVLELLLDERADRPNIDVRLVSSGAKMNPEQTEEVVPKIEQSGQKSLNPRGLHLFLEECLQPEMPPLSCRFFHWPAAHGCKSPAGVSCLFASNRHTPPAHRPRRGIPSNRARVRALAGARHSRIRHRQPDWQPSCRGQ